MPLSKEIITFVSKKTGSLSLSGQGLGDDEVLELAKILQDRPDITSLELQANMFGTTGAIAVLKLPHIVTLDISDNNLKDKVIDDFISFLKEDGNSSLATLNLTKNCLTDKSIHALLQAKQDDDLAKKIVKITFYLSSNEKISSTLLDQFYERSHPPEQKQISDQFAVLNRTSDISQCPPVFLSDRSQKSITEQTKKKKLVAQLLAIIEVNGLSQDISKNPDVLDTVKDALRSIKTSPPIPTQ